MRKANFLVAVALMLGARPLLAEYREIPISAGSSIIGQVRAVGEIPKLPPQPVWKQTETCGENLPDERLVVGPGGELQNAVVYLADIKAGKGARLDQPVKLDNRKCSFVPHVLTATFGQTLEIHNSDPFLHDAHALLGSKTLFNVGIISGRTVRQPLLETGLVHLNCNVRHTWMHGYLFVSEHPYHAVTDAEGGFRFDDVPGGIWTLRVWHELLGSTDYQVRIMPGETKTVEINLQAPAAEH